MKSVFRIVRLLSLLGIVVSIILLLNITAPNPTGRRYSSTMPLTTNQGSAQAIGLSAEEILSVDLRLPRNEDVTQRQCICNPGASASINLNDCRACFAYSEAISTYRRPDFVGRNFIAESKNRRNLLYTQSDQVEQITDYAAAAQFMRQPLWVFVRVYTTLSPEFRQVVEATGGGIVYYFTVPGYVDPVDVAARGILMLSIAVGGAVWLMGWVARRLKSRPVFVTLPSPPKTPKRPTDPVSRAVHKTGAAENFIERAKDKERRRLDIEDARDE